MFTLNPDQAGAMGFDVRGLRGMNSTCIVGLCEG